MLYVAYSWLDAEHPENAGFGGTCFDDIGPPRSMDALQSIINRIAVANDKHPNRIIVILGWQELL
jgi:hypothetical protein